MVETAFQASHARAIRRAGVPVKFQRVMGQYPSAIVVPTGGSAVTAIVRNVVPDSDTQTVTGYGDRQVGAISQDDRQIIVMAADLAAQGFPLPVKKNDQVVLVSSGDVLSVTMVDAMKRAIAGAIELTATGAS